MEAGTDGIKRGPFGGALKKEIFVEEGFAVYEQQHAIYKKFDDVRYFIPSDKYQELISFRLQPGDIIMSCSGTIGKIALFPSNAKEGVINQALIRFRAKVGEVDNVYLRYLLESDYMQKNMTGKNPGSAIKNLISVSELKQIKVPLFPQDEQSKIASFFSLIDQKIESQQEKLRQVELLKKGIMKRILNREIEFKDENGHNYPDWNMKSFGEISKKVGPKNSKGGEYPVYSISNKFGFIPQSEQFEESRLEDLDKSSYKIVTKGQFAYNPARINVGSIGLMRLDEPVIVSSLYVCFELSEEMNNEFVNQYFKSDFFQREVLRNLEGSVREYLFYENFSNVNIYVPSFKEQQKIADCLILFDKKIEIEMRKLELLRQFKIGLMQQIFG
ncbi:restriction endonuclease subunit S [Paenibacillus sp. DMB5]|uniref:restriction endonuclease subunit S n=1 Tax=Paenibacillus sp. DMB5 TaxID=1780103 RepID=UPI001F51CF5F|nr:restriction endonuclease subunit S [Paenibacillus sp. DMB5]